MDSQHSCNLPWRVELFGSLRVRCGDRVYTQFRTRKAAALLAYLAYYPAGDHGRDKLMDLFWPEARVKSARMCLSVELSTFRSEFRGAGPDGVPLLLIDRSTVCLNSAAVSTDVQEFEASAAAGMSSRDDLTRERHLMSAVNLYTGDLLPGYYDSWIVPEQTRLASLYFQALVELVILLERRGDLTQAVQLAYKAVRVEPFREDVQHRLITLLLQLDMPAAALKTYNEFEFVLGKEMGRELSREMRQLGRDLRRFASINPNRSFSEADADMAPEYGPGLAAANASGIQPRLMLLTGSHSDRLPSIIPCLAHVAHLLGWRVSADFKHGSDIESAASLDEEIRSAHAVMPVLTRESIESEAFTHGLEVAHEQALVSGAPRILPLRFDYNGAFPPSMAAILDPLPTFLWEPDGDPKLNTERLLNMLLDRRTDTGVTRVPLEAHGGVLPLDSPFYVTRPADRDLRSALEKQHRIILVKGQRQSGKTSLVSRALESARAGGAQVIWTDFQKLSLADMESPDRTFLALAESIADQLGIEVLMDEVWNPGRSPNRNFERYIRREVLARTDRPVVWAMDGVDRLFPVSFASEVFSLFRSWHNECAVHSSAPWRQLTMVILYAAEAHLFIRDLNVSPFNVGLQVNLRHFTVEELEQLNRCSGSPLRSNAEIERLHRLTGGHPHLCRLALNEMTAAGVSLETIESSASGEDGIFRDHLRRLLLALSQQPEVCEALRLMLRGDARPGTEAIYLLRSAGVLDETGSERLRFSSQIYAGFLREHF